MTVKQTNRKRVLYEFIGGILIASGALSFVIALQGMAAYTVAPNHRAQQVRIEGFPSIVENGQARPEDIFRGAENGCHAKAAFIGGKTPSYDGNYNMTGLICLYAHEKNAQVSSPFVPRIAHPDDRNQYTAVHALSVPIVIFIAEEWHEH